MRRPRVVVSEQSYSVQSRGSQHSAGVLPKSPEPSFGFQLPLHTSSVQGWGVQQRSSVLPGKVSQSLDFTYLVLLQGCVSLHIKGMQQSSRVFPGASGSSTGLKSLMGRHSLKDPQVLGLRHKFVRITSWSVTTASLPRYSKPLSLAKDFTVSVAYRTSSTTPPGTVSVKKPWPPPVKA